MSLFEQLVDDAIIVIHEINPVNHNESPPNNYLPSNNLKSLSSTAILFRTLCR